MDTNRTYDTLGEVNFAGGSNKRCGKCIIYGLVAAFIVWNLILLILSSVALSKAGNHSHDDKVEGFVEAEFVINPESKKLRKDSTGVVEGGVVSLKSVQASSTSSMAELTNGAGTAVYLDKTPSGPGQILERYEPTEQVKSIRQLKRFLAGKEQREDAPTISHTTMVNVDADTILLMAEISTDGISNGTLAYYGTLTSDGSIIWAAMNWIPEGIYEVVTLDYSNRTFVAVSATSIYFGWITLDPLSFYFTVKKEYVGAGAQGYFPTIAKLDERHFILSYGTNPIAFQLEVVVGIADKASETVTLQGPVPVGGVGNFVSSVVGLDDSNFLAVYTNISNSSAANELAGPLTVKLCKYSSASGNPIQCSLDEAVLYGSAANYFFSTSRLQGQKAVIAYVEGNNNDALTAVVVNVNDANEISFGSPLAFGSGSTSGNAEHDWTSAVEVSTFLPDADKFLITYTDPGNLGKVTAITGIVTESSDLALTSPNLVLTSENPASSDGFYWVSSTTVGPDSFVVFDGRAQTVDDLIYSVGYIRGKPLGIALNDEGTVAVSGVVNIKDDVDELVGKNGLTVHTLDPGFTYFADPLGGVFPTRIPAGQPLYSGVLHTDDKTLYTEASIVGFALDKERMLLKSSI